MPGNIEHCVVSVCHVRLEAQILVLSFVDINVTKLLELACMSSPWL